MLRHVPAILGLLGISFAATTSATPAPLPPYTLAATKACLERLPDAVAGLPPARPPMPPAVFVYAFRRDRLTRHVVGELGAWRGHNGTYEGMSLSFFRNGRAARAATRSLVELDGGRRIGNVVVAWDQGSVPRRSLRARVLGCLREGPAGAPIPKREPPSAALVTFAGYWGGHTRGLRITQGGRGHEFVDAGCCTRAYGLALRILSVRGTVTRATATYRLTSFDRYDSAIPRLHVGQVGRLELRNGILTNTLSQTYFCSLPAWGATGLCGA